MAYAVVVVVVERSITSYHPQPSAELNSIFSALHMAKHIRYTPSLPCVVPFFFSGNQNDGDTIILPTRSYLRANEMRFQNRAVEFGLIWTQ